MNQEIKKYIITCLKSMNNYFKSRDIIYFLFCYGNYIISEPELRDYINQLRNEGNLIIASNKGYKLTNDREEIAKYLKSRWGELTREMKPLKAMANSCNMIDQLTIWDYENQVE